MSSNVLKLKALPPESLQRSGSAIVEGVELPLASPVSSGMGRSLPGEVRKVQVKPSDVFPVYTLPPEWESHLRPEWEEDVWGAAWAPEQGPRPEMGKMEYVKALAWTGALWRYAECPCRVLHGPRVAENPFPKVEIPPAVVKRLVHELAVVTEVGYADYFLIVWDICRFAAQQGIPFLARGSAADSLLCYVLGISTVCPIRFQLYFERFLNVERMKFSKLADIDLDFPWDERDVVMQYVFDRWGVEHVAMIGGFSRYHGRAAVADIGKAFGLSETEVRRFTKLLPRVAADKVAEAMGENVRLQEVPTEEEPYPEIMAMAGHLTDLPRHTMMHPCGIVISRERLCRVVPLMASGRGPQMTQVDMDAVEDLGLVKIDLLGQAGLSVLRDVLRRVQERWGKTICLETLDWEDPVTWQLVATGGARGVHHIESPAMTSLLVMANCRDMDCLCAVVSVIRPGAADENKKLLFTRRHQGLAPVEYPHPSLEPYLRDTYGLLVFEEHILMVAHHFAGMNLGRSDVLRRELVKMKSPEKLIQLGHEFKDCALALGRTEDEVRDVWRTLVAFHGYMFNKAHSASYAVEAYQGAWLKARFPGIYMAAVLSNSRGFYTAFFYSLECRRLGFRMVLPCVNALSSDYEQVALPENGKGGIQLPLRTIKGLGEQTWQAWRRERSKSAFTSLENFVRRVGPQVSEMPLFVESGSLDALGAGLTRPEIFWRLKELMHSGILGTQAGGGLLEGLEMLPTSFAKTRQTLADPPPEQKAWREWELLGFPVTVDPWTLLGPNVAWDTVSKVAKLESFFGKIVRVTGLVVQTRHNHTLKGDVMQFFTLADPTGYVECTVFPIVYRKWGHLVRRNYLISLSGKVEPFDNSRGYTLDVKKVEVVGVPPVGAS